MVREHSLVHWYQQCVTVHHVPKCMSCYKVASVRFEHSVCRGSLMTTNICIYILYIYSLVPAMWNYILYAQVHEWPFGVSSETYMIQTAKQNREHLKFHHPLFKYIFENFIWHIKWSAFPNISTDCLLQKIS